MIKEGIERSSFFSCFRSFGRSFVTVMYADRYFLLAADEPFVVDCQSFRLDGYRNWGPPASRMRGGASISGIHVTDALHLSVSFARRFGFYFVLVRNT